MCEVFRAAIFPVSMKIFTPISSFFQSLPGYFSTLKGLCSSQSSPKASALLSLIYCLTGKGGSICEAKRNSSSQRQIWSNMLGTTNLWKGKLGGKIKAFTNLKGLEPPEVLAGVLSEVCKSITEEWRENWAWWDTPITPVLLGCSWEGEQWRLEKIWGGVWNKQCPVMD